MRELESLYRWIRCTAPALRQCFVTFTFPWVYRSYLLVNISIMRIVSIHLRRWVSRDIIIVTYFWKQPQMEKIDLKIFKIACATSCMKIWQKNILVQITLKLTETAVWKTMGTTVKLLVETKLKKRIREDSRRKYTSQLP